MLCRDYDTARHQEVLPFTSDIAAFKAFVGGIAMYWSRDLAEDVFTGLQAVQSLTWQAGSRVLVHVGDAPCHGQAFHEPVRHLSAVACLWMLIYASRPQVFGSLRHVL